MNVTDDGVAVTLLAAHETIVLRQNRVVKINVSLTCRCDVSNHSLVKYDINCQLCRPNQFMSINKP